MQKLKSSPRRFVRAALTVGERRVADYATHSSPASRITIWLMEAVGVTLFALGALAVGAFLEAETPAEAAGRGLALVPQGCEAGYYMGGRYLCWFTISGHPLVFLLSLLVCIFGVMLAIWGKNLADKSSGLPGA
jgi:hypothetical protein